MTDFAQIESMLGSAEEEERLQGLKHLARASACPDLRLLYRVLGDPSWRIRKEAAEIFLALPRAGELAGEIVELLHSQDNAGLRNTAVEILVSLGRRGMPFLLEELGCSDHDVRKFVLDILGEIRDAEAVPAMVSALDDPDENVRAAAAENLGKIWAAAAVPALLGSLRHSDLLFRFTVLEALGQIGTAVPVENLLAFRDEKLLRKALFDCLGHIGAVETLPVLLDGVTDSMRNVREAAATALVRIAQHRPGEVEALLSSAADGPVPDALADLLDSAHLHVRRAACLLLGMVGEGRFAPRMIVLVNDPDVRDSALAALVALGRNAACSLMDMWARSDDHIRACLAFILGEARCEGAEALLLQGLAGSDPELRIGSAQALGRIGGAAAIAPLSFLFGDPSEDVRDAASNALRRLAPQYPGASISVLQPILQEDDPRKRMLAIGVLGELAGAEVDSALALAVKDESSFVRQAAIRAFEGRTGTRPVAGLSLALTDEDSEVRRTAVELLGTTGDPEALGALRSALQDEDIWVRTAAVRGIGRLGGAEAAGVVSSALADPVGLVNIAALEVLVDLDPDGAYAHVEKALRHPDEEVVNAALGLLSSAGRTSWIPAVRDRLINHPHWDVRITFARTLAALVGPDCRKILEGRLLVEGEDLVRQHLQTILDDLAGEGG